MEKEKKCNCLIGEGNMAVKIENVFERNGFVYLWDKLKNEYLDKDKTKAVLDFPTYFVVCPTSLDERWEKDIVCTPSADKYCDDCSISLMQAAMLFSMNNKAPTNNN